MLRGSGVSAGVAKGVAFVVACGLRSAAPRRSILASEVESERARFEAALARAAAELGALQGELNERIGQSQADIFGAQLLALEDRGLHDRVLQLVGSGSTWRQRSRRSWTRTPGRWRRYPTRISASGRPTSATWAAASCPP